jgi:hypothetical protein
MANGRLNRADAGSSQDLQGDFPPKQENLHISSGGRDKGVYESYDSSTNLNFNFESGRPRDRFFAYSHLFSLICAYLRLIGEKDGDRQDACPTMTI